MIGTLRAKVHVSLFQAVKHLHDNNLVHVDIKPDNIFISYEGVCKLGDFGLVIDLAKVKHCLGKEKNMCGSGYPTYPKFLPSTLKNSPNSEVGRE